jgi:hypothetical protein
MGEGKSQSCVCILELFIVDEIKKGVFVFLGLLIDDSAMSLKKAEYKSVLMNTFIDFCG